MGSANPHDSTGFVDAVEDISECLDDHFIEQILQRHAGKGYDAKHVRMHLGNRNTACCIPCETNSGLMLQDNVQSSCGKTRYVVEGFSVWLRLGFRRTAKDMGGLPGIIPGWQTLHVSRRIGGFWDELAIKQSYDCFLP